jgi:hypothetical protein
MDDGGSPMGGDSSSRGFSNWSKSPSGREGPAASTSPGQSNASAPTKKRKLEIKEVFNTEDDDDGSLGGGAGRKRKPLVPLGISILLNFLNEYWNKLFLRLWRGKGFKEKRSGFCKFKSHTRGETEAH